MKEKECVRCCKSLNILYRIKINATKIGILYAKIVQTLRGRITNTMFMAGHGRALKIVLFMSFSVINISTRNNKKLF